MTCSSTHGMALYATDCSMEGGGVSQEAGLCGFPSSLLLLCRPEQSPWDFSCLFLFFWGYFIQHCFICRPSDSTVPMDAGIEPRAVATVALAVRRSNH
jgi:hypothetical protein